MASCKLFEISDDTLEKVLQELNYSSVNLLDKDVEIIKEWMKTQPHLPEIMDDKRIQNFLILNKGSIEKSKEKIDNYYCMRSHLPEILDNSNPKLPNMKYMLDNIYFVPLPKLTKDRYRVFLNKIRKTTFVEKFNFVDVIGHLVNVQEVRLFEDITYGDIIIFDGKDIPLSAALQSTPTLVYKMFALIYKRVFSNRLKAIYVINAPPYTEMFMSLLKKILKPKLLNRINFSSNSDFLIEKLGKELIPKDYGGEERPLAEINQMLEEKFKEYEDHFNKMDKLKIDERLRPEKLKNDDMLGYYGNFKLLEID